MDTDTHELAGLVGQAAAATAAAMGHQNPQAAGLMAAGHFLVSLGCHVGDPDTVRDGAHLQAVAALSGTNLPAQ